MHRENCRIFNANSSAFARKKNGSIAIMRFDDEVAEILEVPLAALMDDRLPLVEDWDLPLPGEPWTAPAPDAPPEQRRRTIRYYPWQGHRIWGATARMIEHLVTAIREGRIAVPAHA